MLHPLFTTIIQRPDLLVDHVSAYAALVHKEASHAGSEILIKAAAWVVAGVSALVFLILAAIALMLGVMHDQFHWVLVAVPAVPLIIGAAAVFLAIRPMQSKPFPELKAQLDSDARALRMAA